MGLLFPAAHSVLEAARRINCQSQMSQLGKAATLYEGTYGLLPAYHTTLGTDPNSTNVGWPVMILPQLDHMDLWTAWSQVPTKHQCQHRLSADREAFDLHLSERPARLDQGRRGRPVLVHRQRLSLLGRQGAAAVVREQP